VGFGPTIAASERAKTVRAIDRATTVTGLLISAVYFHTRSLLI
jgi:hypothetical protein